MSRPFGKPAVQPARRYDEAIESEKTPLTQSKAESELPAKDSGLEVRDADLQDPLFFRQKVKALDARMNSGIGLNPLERCYKQMLDRLNSGFYTPPVETLADVVRRPIDWRVALMMWLYPVIVLFIGLSRYYLERPGVDVPDSMHVLPWVAPAILALTVLCMLPLGWSIFASIRRARVMATEIQKSGLIQRLAHDPDSLTSELRLSPALEKLAGSAGNSVSLERLVQLLTFNLDWLLRPPRLRLRSEWFVLPLFLALNLTLQWAGHVAGSAASSAYVAGHLQQCISLRSLSEMSMSAGLLLYAPLYACMIDLVARGNLNYRLLMANFREHLIASEE